MNKTDHIFGILGIKKDEPFYIGSNKYVTYTYDGEKLNSNNMLLPTAYILYALIFMPDEYEIHPVTERPWRPELGEFYWSLNSLGQAVRNENCNSAFDICMFNTGNAFKTEAEAKINGGKVDE